LGQSKLRKCTRYENRAVLSRRAPLADQEHHILPALQARFHSGKLFLTVHRLLVDLEDDVAAISAGDRRGRIEREMLRPLVRGETLAAWKTIGKREYLVWPHCDNNRPRKELPPLARRWLLPFRDQLAARSDLRGRLPWWTVFRTDCARHERARVVWADFGICPRAIVVEPGDPIVPLNTCYAVRCNNLDDAHGLGALLNSPLASAWLNVVAG